MTVVASWCLKLLEKRQHVFRAWERANTIWGEVDSWCISALPYRNSTTKKNMSRDRKEKASIAGVQCRQLKSDDDNREALDDGALWVGLWSGRREQYRARGKRRGSLLSPLALTHHRPRVRARMLAKLSLCLFLIGV